MSAHPYHIKKSVVFSQTLRIKRLYSSEKDFKDHKEEMSSWIMKREYLENLIRSEMNKVKFSNFRPKNNDKNHNMKGILVVTYHPSLISLSGISDIYIYLIWIKNRKKYLPPNPWFHFVVLAS